jgi:N-acetyl-gamma-glutamyl-phosphate reductase
MKIETAVIGASGYGGAELLRLMAHHAHFEPVLLIANSQAGARVRDLYPHLYHLEELRFKPLDQSREQLAQCRLVFCALPHGEAMRMLPGLKNEVIIDLGGDFRLKSAEDYERWYGLKHECPEALPSWVYGLPEFFRAEIRGAARISNPGCYATAAILAGAPLLAKGLVEGALVIDALSGVSGAGRTPKAETNFSHVADDLRAYKVARHQHTPEIEMALGKYAGKRALVSFTPHLVPAVRGIHVTCSGELSAGAAEKDLVQIFRDVYAGEPFIRVVESGAGTKEVRGSNFVALTPYLDRHSGRVIVTCVLDNLVKGAAGQALQNANLRFGFDEGLGLDDIALYP